MKYRTIKEVIRLEAEKLEKSNIDKYEKRPVLIGKQVGNWKVIRANFYSVKGSTSWDFEKVIIDKA